METDSLTKLAATGEQHFTQVLPLEEIDLPTVDQKEAFPIEIGNIWTTPIFYYLTLQSRSEDKLEARRLVMKALNYGIVDGYTKEHTFNLNSNA